MKKNQLLLASSLILLASCTCPCRTANTDLSKTEATVPITPTAQAPIVSPISVIKAPEAPTVQITTKPITTTEINETNITEKVIKKPKKKRRNFISQKIHNIRNNYLQKKFTKRKTRAVQLNKSNFRLGESLPHTVFLGANGGVVDLNDFHGKKKVLLTIMRGFNSNICIACVNQTAVLSRHKEQFAQADTELAVIYPGKIETVPTFLEAVSETDEDFKPSLPIFLDVDLSAVKKFQIEGDLSKPTTVLIDKQGLIEYVYVGKGPTDRPSIKSLLEIIRKPAKI